jgi:hypothetical protein
MKRLGASKSGLPHFYRPLASTVVAQQTVKANQRNNKHPGEYRRG